MILMIIFGIFTIISIFFMFLGIKSSNEAVFSGSILAFITFSLSAIIPYIVSSKSDANNNYFYNTGEHYYVNKIEYLKEAGLKTGLLELVQDYYLLVDDYNKSIIGKKRLKKNLFFSWFIVTTDSLPLIKPALSDQ